MQPLETPINLKQIKDRLCKFCNNDFYYLENNYNKTLLKCYFCNYMFNHCNIDRDLSFEEITYKINKNETYEVINSNKKFKLNIHTIDNNNRYSYDFEVVKIDKNIIINNLDELKVFINKQLKLRSLY